MTALRLWEGDSAEPLVLIRRPRQSSNPKILPVKALSQPRERRSVTTESTKQRSDIRHQQRVNLQRVQR